MGSVLVVRPIWMATTNLRITSVPWARVAKALLYAKLQGKFKRYFGKRRTYLDQEHKFRNAPSSHSALPTRVVRTRPLKDFCQIYQLTQGTNCPIRNFPYYLASI